MPINWQIEVFDELPSTMTIAQLRGESGAPEGTVIIAKNQTAGIGRRGNVWMPKDGNLYASIVLRSIIVKDAGQYSFIAAVALADAVKPLLKNSNSYQHKWPNDGLLNGVKFAGILPHLGDNFLNLGIGINIADAPDDRAYLNQDFRQPVTAPEFLDIYLKSLGSIINEYRAYGFAPIRVKWLENAKGLAGPITARLPNEEISGVFADLDEEGGLILKLDNGATKVIRSGEVYFGNDK